MALRRFHIEKQDLREGSVTIHGDLFHHIREVCRFAEGDIFEVLPGDGTAVKVKIVSVAKKELRAEALATRFLPAPRKPFVTLALSIPKLPKVDWIVEKCVELGVHEIRPFVSDYSFCAKFPTFPKTAWRVGASSCRPPPSNRGAAT
ncbi:MAG: RsmE family RNA methyltransferase [Calothrix sp. SM1_5_4]|nr:RsmE family RNA methyltransferase [Calothrix sp. SM1_5_4]